MVKPFSCVVVALVRQRLAASFTRGFFHLHLGKWLVGELPGAALRWWPLGVGCGSNCFLPALGLSVWTSSVHLGRRAQWVLGAKGGRCNQSRKPVCSFCFYDSNSSSLTHPLSSQRRSILLQFSTVESSLLSDLDSPSPSVFFWSKVKHLVGPRSTTSRILIRLCHITGFPSFPIPPPGVQDILSLIAETDHECDLRPAAIVGQVERVLSGNSGDAT